MKKTYIKPESIVVAINMKAHLMINSIPQSETPADPNDSGVGDIGGSTLSREVLNIPDPWEEW
jgi:hypothetical protein